MRKKRIFIAGAYSAPDVISVFDNMRRGMDLAYRTVQAGYAVFCPWQDHHYSLTGPMTLEQYYENTLAWLEVSDALLCVPEGLEQSRGAQKEIARAAELGIPVFHTLHDLMADEEMGTGFRFRRTFLGQHVVDGKPTGVVPTGFDEVLPND